MTDVASAWPKPHMRLRTAIEARLAATRASTSRFLHHDVTVGEVAAFVLTSETLRTAKGKASALRDPAAIADAVADDAAGLVASLRAIASDQETVVLGMSDRGVVSRRYDAGQNRIWCRGVSPGFVSPAFHGVLPALPALPVDVRTWTPRLQDAIEDMGGRGGSAARARMIAAEGGSIDFVMPAADADPAFELRDHMLNAAHSSPERIVNAIRHHARKAALRDHFRKRGEKTLKELRHAILSRIAGVEGLALESVRLYTVDGKYGIVGIRADDPVFIFHAHVSHIGETLEPRTTRFILRSDAGIERTTLGVDLDTLVLRHRRARVTASGRGLEWDAVALALVRRAGLDRETIEADLSRTPDRAAITDASRAWARASGGRITISMPVGCGATWKHDELEVKETVLPRTAAMALAGQMASRVVDDPVFGDSVIRSVTSRGGRTFVRMEPQWVDMEEVRLSDGKTGEDVA